MDPKIKNVSLCLLWRWQSGCLMHIRRFIAQVMRQTSNPCNPQNLGVNFYQVPYRMLSIAAEWAGDLPKNIGCRPPQKYLNDTLTKTTTGQSNQQ
ncbi:hypothetical protein CDAR_300061 [Caerostris darwini]|uniref:Uncharacterized protein n=1 Tax=Caerostris darwini TaxID=1538125 RepID=A0AAV4W303_9ARAC|nr:hypothetical protein CDAR_300061 [Caerostris darwini]